jgi:subtilisin
MKTRFFAAILTISTLMSAPAGVLAAPSAGEDARFFVQTGNGLIKGALGVRHQFEDGFTTEASGLQLQLAKLMGVKVYEVKKYTILPADELPDVAAVTPDVLPVAEPTAEPVAQPAETTEPKARPTKAPAPRVRPTDSEPWGVAMVRDGDDEHYGVGVTVAVLDTGVLTSHPDLTRRVKQCVDFSQAKSPVVEGKCADGNGHGTHVAGIIAADGGADNKGIVGVAPEAELFAFKVCGNSGSCWSDDIAVGIRTATDRGANIINLSLGSDAKSSLIEDAVNYAASKGVLVVAASGNDGPYEGSIDYPGALASVIAVGALDEQKAVADFSSRGINMTTELGVINEGDIEFVAPGVNVESTYRDGGYAVLSGTSMASPHAAGLAAALWVADPISSASATRELLREYAHDIALSGEDNDSGYGLPMMTKPLVSQQALPLVIEIPLEL